MYAFLTDEDGNNGDNNKKPRRAVVDEAAGAGDVRAVAENDAVAPVHLRRKRVMHFVDFHRNDADARYPTVRQMDELSPQKRSARQNLGLEQPMGSPCPAITPVTST